MKRNGGLFLAGAVVVVATSEVLFHWLLGRGVFPRLLSIYLSADAGGKHFIGGVVDSIAPAIVLGCVNGWVGFPRWSLRALCGTTFGLAALVVAMLPVYRALMGAQRFAVVWGLPQDVSMFSHVFRTVSALIVVGFFTRAAYVFRRDWHPRAPEP